MVALLLSTNPVEPDALREPKSMSVGSTLDAFLGQATQSRPAVSSDAAIRSNYRISSACGVELSAWPATAHPATIGS